MIDEAELACARVAVEAVAARGGCITYAEYDDEMRGRVFFAPLHWCAGWGDGVLLRRNNEKLAAFAAVRAGLLVAIEGGYALP